MDLRRVRFAEMLALVGGLALLVALFLPWYDFAGKAGGLTKHSAWTSLTVALAPLLLGALSAIYLFVITLARARPGAAVAAGVWCTLFGFIASIFALAHVAGLPAGAADRCSGVWLGAIAALVIAAAGWLSMRDERPLRGVRVAGGG